MAAGVCWHADDTSIWGLRVARDTCSVRYTSLEGRKLSMEKVSVSATIKTPFTTQDVQVIENLCEDLISMIQENIGRYESVYARNTAEDILDCLIDIKVDISEWGKSNATLMHDDGFCDPVTLGERNE